MTFFSPRPVGDEALVGDALRVAYPPVQVGGDRFDALLEKLGACDRTPDDRKGEED